MPRKARIDAPGALHHIIARGIEGRPIFLDDIDRNKFVERLGGILQDTDTPCYAWALMQNHLHLLLKTGLTPVATIMRRVLTGHAIYFNLRHTRHGHLFQNRYKSILCQEETYLLELVRYIHLNPLRAGLVNEMAALDKYPYGGHSCMIAKIPRNWHSTGYVLGVFAKRKSTAIKEYRRFMAQGVSPGKRPDLTGGGLIRSAGGWTAISALKGAGLRIKSDERILGNSDFVESVLNVANEQLERHYHLAAKGFGLSQIANRVAHFLDIPEALVWEKSRRPIVVRARDLLCYWASTEIGMSKTEIAKRVGIKQPAVSIAVRRGEKIALKNAYRLIPE